MAFWDKSLWTALKDAMTTARARAEAKPTLGHVAKGRIRVQALSPCSSNPHPITP